MRNSPGDIIATLNLLTTHKGGRQGPTPADEFSCIMVIDGKNFSIKLNLQDTGSLHPGQTATVPVSFLYPELVAPHCAVGKRFTLREINTIAAGRIEEILFTS
jgi:hypothetical protein